MNVAVKGKVVLVTLSARNLKTLLSKVGREESARTLVRQTEGGHNLWVIAEDDETHYAGRKPGNVHPLDEPKP